MKNAWTVIAAGQRDRPAWDAFVATRPDASAYHDYQWRGILEQVFATPSWYLLARDGNGRVGGVLPLVRLKSLLFGDFLVSMPYLNYGGVLASDPDADAALIKSAVTLARELHVDHIELRETGPRGTEWPVRTEKVAMVLELADDPGAQFGALGAKLRSQIRRPEREGARVAYGHCELLPDFYRVFARNMRDLGTPVYARGFFHAILAALGESAEIVVVYVGTEPAAAGFLVHHRDRTEIPWASSLRQWNRVGVNMQLYWCVIRRAIERRSRHFDFGRSTVDAGTYRFKAQWGARPRPLFWHYWLPDGRPLPGLNPSNPKYALAIRTWQRLPLWLANLAGPPIVRRLP